MTVSLPKLHAGQHRVHETPARYKVLACGRRWGKTRLGALECVAVGLTGGRAWWVAPSYKVAQVGWRLITRLAKQIPGAEVRLGELAVSFPGDGSVFVRSADNPDGLRGEGLDLVVMDECAFIREEAWTDALRPALSDRRGSAIFISTPKGRNWFWRMFMRGQAGEDGYRSWQLPTADNPYIAGDEIEKARLDLPELTFQQEYLAEFLENQGGVFRRIDEALGAPLQTSPDAHERHKIVAGVDWAKAHDYTAVSFGCATCRQEVARDRFNKIDYVFQRGRLAEMARQWQPALILVESNSIGTPIAEQLQRDGLPVAMFETTAASKPPLIENLALAIERREWQLQADPIWTGELEAYERTISPQTGRSQYSAPEGLHDDTVIARALMLRAAGSAVDLPDQPVQRTRWDIETAVEDARWRRY